MISRAGFCLPSVAARTQRSRFSGSASGAFRRDSSSSSSSSLATKLLAYGGAGAFAAGCLYAQLRQLRAEAANHKSAAAGSGGRPLFKREEVAKHRTMETGVWVIHGTGVYDVTSFIPNHPGGSKIMLAAGASVEPFWKVCVHSYIRASGAI